MRSHVRGVAMVVVATAGVAMGAACGGSDPTPDLELPDAQSETGVPDTSRPAEDATMMVDAADAASPDASDAPSCAPLALTSVTTGAPAGDGGAGDAGDGGDAGAATPSLCGAGGTLTLRGTGFLAGATVTAGTRTATSVIVSADGKSAVATFGDGAPDSPVTVALTNPDGCTTAATTPLAVIAGPLVLFADPPAAWNGMNTPVAIYAANVSPAVKGVSIVPTGAAGPITDLTFTPAAGHPDRPVALVPKGTAPGTYDVRLSDQSGCPAVLPSALKITASTALTLTGISPGFGWTGASTPVSLSASTAAGSPGFGSFPRGYLVPSTGPSATYPIDSTSVVSATSMTGVVPKGLPVAQYDVVVVNVDNSVGVLPAAFSSTGLEPPVVQSVTPGQVPNTTTSQAISIQGLNFRAGAPSNKPSVVFRCIDGAGAALADQTLAVSAFTATSITATLDATKYGRANCLARVTNTDDGSIAEFASVVIVTATQDLNGFVAGPPMSSARRALGSVSGGVSQASRFVYAIAGDDGAAALDSVEVLPVDIFGKPGPAFFTQRNKLTAARTETTAVKIGRFIYVVGGATAPALANGAVKTLERAAILDDTTRPANAGVDVAVVKAAGVGAGTFYYRVAAMMPANDPFNPGGETLPSAQVPVRLPALPAGYGASVKLAWDAVPGAVGYRLYRTAANGAAGSETLLADTRMLPAGVACASATATSCVDSGGAILGALTPLLPGSTGTWVTLAETMTNARQAAGVTWALDPTNANKAYIYVLGGRDATGGVRADYELLTITIDPVTGAQDTSLGFVTGTSTLLVGRWRLRAYTVTPSDTALVNGSTYVWAGGGMTLVPNQASAHFEGAIVLPGGQLGVLADSSTMQPPSAGYGAFAAGDYLYALGGSSGNASIDATSVKHTGAPPAIINWNGAGGLSMARVDLGATIQSGYFYVLGGRVANGTVTKTIELTLY